MTATFLKTARPAHAVIMWSDDNNIYVELPCKGDNPPFIQKFAYSDGGLSKALGFLKVQKNKTYGETRYRYEEPKDHPLVRRTAAVEAALSPEEAERRQKARDILKKMGLT